MSLALAVRKAALAPGKWVSFPSALWRRAKAAPSLDLRFAENKSLVDATTGSNLVTFTRASSGTFVGSDGLIKTATTNEPRFDHNPTTGESLGLLVEERRTNLLLHSACDSNWPTGGFGTAIYNLGLSALGVFSGVQVASSGQNWHSIYRTGINLTASTIYAFTLFYRAGTSGRVRLTFRNNSTSTETIANGLAGKLSVLAQFAGSAAILSQYLCSDGLTYVVTGTYQPDGTSVDHWFRIGPDSTVSGQTVIALGAQLEAGAFPTSYIPTTTATVTRSADVASITGTAFSSWYRQDEGTLYAEGSVPVGVSGSRALAGISDGTQNERILIGHNGTTAAAALVSGGNVVQFNATVSANSFPPGERRKIALAYKTDDFGFTTVPGITVEQDSSGTLPTVDRLQIGLAPGRSEPCAPIRRLTYFPQRLPNSTLQSVTQ